jgi:hypothetical protein
MTEEQVPYGSVPPSQAGVRANATRQQRSSNRNLSAIRPVSDQVFAFDHREVPTLTHERCLASDLGLKESWLRDAIFAVPELVIGPCRAAGLTDDDWYPWVREFGTDVGPVDVLLLSSQGRVAVVETKLASNPELRRKVLAQALDYLTHLPEALADRMPAIPKDGSGDPVADPDDIRESVSQGDVLVIIASDEIDPRVARLSRGLLAEHLVNQWDLALVDVGLYRAAGGSATRHIVIPHLRNLVESEPRQVVRVIVEGETPRARVEVERITHEETASVRQKWDEKRFFENLGAYDPPAEVRDFALRLRDLVQRYEGSVILTYGTSKEGSMIVKRNGAGLIEVYGSGKVKFRPEKFARALGDRVAGEYRHRLEQLLPQAMRMEYPRVAPKEAAKIAPALHELIQQTLDEVER